MSETQAPPKTPAEILAELEQLVAERTVAVKGEDPETARKIEDAQADLEYLALVAKFNQLGKQDHAYTIVDLTAHGQGFVVLVINERAELHRRMIQQAAKGDDAIFDAKATEIVRECVKHPALDVYDAVASKLPAVPNICLMAVQDLWGARAKIRRGK